MALYAYLNELPQEEKSGKTGGVQDTVTQAAGILYARQEVEKRVGRNYLEHSPILRGRAGIQYSYSSLPDKEQCIDLAAVYEVRPVLALPGIMDMRLVNRCRMKSWTGFALSEGTDAEVGEESVYVTEYGSVYHLSASCTHLKLSVRETPLTSVPGLRNEGGAKYYLCEICHSQTPQRESCYITMQGDRYHYSINCGGLKRSVRTVSARAAQAQGLRVCSRCG